MELNETKLIHNEEIDKSMYFLSKDDTTKFETIITKLYNLIKDGLGCVLIGKRKLIYHDETLAVQLNHYFTWHNLIAVPIFLIVDTEEEYNKCNKENIYYDKIYYRYDVNIKEISSIINSYKLIDKLKLSMNDNKDEEGNEHNQNIIHELLSINREINLDCRFIEEMNHKLSLPSNNAAQFIMREVIAHPCFLIEEDLLAARLGIDKNKSSDWNVLLEKYINPYCKYKGIYSDIYDRLVMGEIENWWRNNIIDKSLQGTDGDERVERIIKFTGLNNLVEANKLPGCRSNSFWYICSGYKKPIGELDFYTVKTKKLKDYSWQEKGTICMDAVVNEINIKEWEDISYSEKDRFTKWSKYYVMKKPYYLTGHGHTIFKKEYKHETESYVYTSFDNAIVENEDKVFKQVPSEIIQDEIIKAQKWIDYLKQFY